MAGSGVRRRLGVPSQAQTPLTSIYGVPVTRPEPWGSREKHGLFLLVSTPRFTAPHISLCLVKIDSVLTVPVCTQTGRKKQPCWRDPTTTGFTTASLSTRAAKTHQPRCGSQHSQTHRSRAGKQRRVQEDRLGPVNQHLLMSVPCQPLRLRRIVKHHSCHVSPSDQPTNITEYLPCVFNNVC